MANKPALNEMKAALQELYKTNPYLLEGLRSTNDPDIITREYYQNLPKILKKHLATDADIINQDPNYYMQDFTFAEALDPHNGATETSRQEKKLQLEIGASLFKMYESKSADIYRIIQTDDLFESINEDPNAFLIDIFADGATNKDTIAFKTKQEIQCVSTKPIVESYIAQSKKDWGRATFFSNKYNKYVNNFSGLPYTQDVPEVDKLFLITVDAINNYFMGDNTSPGPGIGLQIMTDEPISDSLGETDCECKKVKNTLICSEFNILPDLTDNVKKILYNLSFFNQSQKSQIMLRFNALLQAFSEQYATVIATTLGDDGYVNYNLGQGGGYYYIDAKAQSFVYLNTIILVVIYKENTIYVPLYNVIQIYPFAMNDYYYSFLYVDNNPPAIVGQGNWYERAPKLPVTADYYKFLTAKIQWYTRKYDENPANFINGRYRGADYTSYIKKEANEFNKTHKPYVYSYQSRPFVEPDFSRLVGGKTQRRKHKQTKRLKRKHKRTKGLKHKHKQTTRKRRVNT